MNDLEEKPHQPSAKKQAKLRKEGSFLRSRELNSGLVLIAGIAILMGVSTQIVDVLKENLIDAFTAIGDISMSESDFFLLYRKIAFNSVMALAPLEIPLIFVIFATVFLFGGFSWSFHLIKPKMNRLNPIKNLKSKFSLGNVFELIKATLKLFVFFSILLAFLYIELNHLFDISKHEISEAVRDGFELIEIYLLMLACGVALIVAIDVVYSQSKHRKTSMMSHQELRDEHKEAESSPEVKKRIRRAQFAIIKKRMLREIPTASVIITNPTHFAVALQYKEGIHHAPILIAKGKDAIAAEIRLIAVKSGVPIYQAPPLARALFYTANIGEPIHQDLFMAVALVLSYLYQIKLYQHGLAELPQHINDLKIPPHMQFKDRIS